jgi:hypothetical protein
VYVLANRLRNNTQTQITDVELSTRFGHSGAWTQRMTVRHLHSANSENPTARAHPKTINSDEEKKFI